MKVPLGVIKLVIDKTTIRVVISTVILHAKYVNFKICKYQSLNKCNITFGECMMLVLYQKMKNSNKIYHFLFLKIFLN